MTRRVAFDASFLAVLLDASTPVRGSKLPAEEIRNRLTYLVERLDAEDADIVVPAPALAELLVIASREVSALLAVLDEQARFRVVAFDTRAAMECGILIRKGFGSRKPDEDRVRIKFDAMILAVTKVEQATVIYADDDRLCRRAQEEGLQAFGFDNLPPRPTDPQGELLEPARPAPRTAFPTRRGRRVLRRSPEG